MPPGYPEPPPQRSSTILHRARSHASKKPGAIHVQFNRGDKTVTRLAVSAEEAAELLSISRDTFDDQVRDKLNATCFGKRRAYSVDSLERFLERHQDIGGKP